MGIRDLFFKITAQDNTGKAFRSVNDRLRKVEGASASVSQRLDRVGKTMQKVGAAGSVASAGIVAAFRDSLALYDKQAQAEASVAQAIKATGGAAGFTAGELGKQASALQEVTRYGDEDILKNVTARYVGFGNISGQVLARAQKLTLDLAAANNKGLAPSAQKLGASLADPADGLSRLRREGVKFTDAQETVIDKLVATGRVAEAQRVILDQVAESVGGQAVAAAKAGTGSLDQLGNAFGDVKEEIGAVLADFLPPLVKGMTAVTDAFQALSPRGQKVAVVMGALAVAIPPVTLALGFMVTGLAALASPVAAVIAGIAGLTAGVAYFWPQIKTAAIWVGDRFTAALDAVVGAAKTAATWVGDTLTAAFDALTSPVENVRTAFAALPEPVQEAASKTGAAFRALVDPSKSAGEKLDAFQAGWRAQWMAIPEPVRSAVTGASDALVRLVTPFEDTRAAIDALQAKVRAAFTAIPELIGKAADAVGSYIRDKFNAALTSLTDKVGAVQGAFARLYDKVVGNSYVPDMIDEIGVQFARLGGNMEKPAADATAGVESQFDRLSGRVTDRLSRLASDGKLTWESFLGTLADTGARYADRIVSDVFDRLSAGLSGALSGTLGGGGAGAGAGLFGNLLGGAGGAFKALPGFDHGGAFTVGGRAGTDRNVAAIRLSEGERVKVTPRGEGPGGHVPVNIYIQTPDPATFKASRAQIGQQIGRAVAAGQRGA